MKTILCYGDSNTWGFIPSIGARYPFETRWPGVMQAALGKEYRVIEAGLSGRTTVWDDPCDIYMNGRDMLEPTLRTHAPLDLVILMLGTNDLKWHSAWESTRGSWTLICDILKNKDLFTNGKANALWVSPPIVRDPHTIGMADPNSLCTEEESKKFALYSKQFAPMVPVPWFNAADVVMPLREGEFAEGVLGDGVHLPPSAHRALGMALAEQVQRLCTE